jgi:hypothetical protein
MHACTCDIYPTHAVQIQTNATMQMQSPYPKLKNACLDQSSQKVDYRIGGWWWRLSASSRMAARTTVADGGSGELGARWRELLSLNWGVGSTSGCDMRLLAKF